jgi:hypothetical protein
MPAPEATAESCPKPGPIRSQRGRRVSASPRGRFSQLRQVSPRGRWQRPACLNGLYAPAVSPACIAEPGGHRLLHCSPTRLGP